jgi:hypothetical protein
VDYLTIGGRWLQNEIQQAWLKWEHALGQPGQALRDREQASAEWRRRQLHQ